MNAMNDILRTAANQALGALFFLDEAGATVIAIDIRGGRPRITLDGAPSRFIQGAIRKSRPLGGLREHVMVAVVQGCQVEWIVCTRRGDATAQAGA